MVYLKIVVYMEVNTMKFKKNIFLILILSFLAFNVANVSANPYPEIYYKINFGFNESGIHWYKNTEYNQQGFNWKGIHKKTHTKLSDRGYDLDGYKFGIIPTECEMKFCYGKDGYNHRGFNKYHQHINGTMYDDDGYDYLGFHKDTKINKYTGALYDASGYDVNHYDKSGFLDYRYRGGGGLSAPPLSLISLVAVN